MALPERVDAVFFDIGGPLYSDGNFVAAVLTALDDLRAERGLGPADRGRFTALYDDARTAQAGSLRSALAAAFLDPSSRDDLHERTRAHWTHPRGSLYDDARDTLERLHGCATIGVLANQEAAAVDALKRDGLADLVDVWGISALVGHEKPSAALFAWALAQAGTQAAHAVHVGNRLDNDVRPAKALGLGTVWVHRGEAPDRPSGEQLAEADLSVADLTPVADALLPRTRCGHG